MPSNLMLPGLDRLITVCKRHALPMQFSPPLASAPRQGDMIFGESLDPQLAAVYQRLGAAEFSEFALHAPSSDEEGLTRQNEWLRERHEVQYLSSLVFGWEPGFAFYYGTVPRLADPRGLQPVVYICAMEGLFAVPLASSVDRFFNLYSRYLELMVQDPHYLIDGLPHVQFPWHMRTYVAQDAPLIHQVRAGRFDFLSNGYRGALKWLHELRALPP
jgi:hypothetical protein